ncbi:DUF4411 family protein [Rosistilla oblonga]|uniref:DUF4411 family protein n=1 Tax=Rosistilla oblonga TaxID=2527990 RepID=UPI003A96DF6A
MTKYLIDSNSFIVAKNFHYAFDLCPGFWNAILRHHQSDEVYSIDRIRDELLEGNDILVKWVRRKVPTSFFISSNQSAIVAEYARIMEWVAMNYSRPTAVSSFAAKADGWIIATAKVGGFTIVCEEVFDALQQKRVPNPNVCHQFGVPYCTGVNMLRSLQVKFGLRKLPA